MSPTTTEASRYQQLRGHLAYLKLGTAAEALPAVLDAAKTENLSPTATLERLLRIEVEATEARRLERRIRFSNLPTAATIEDFDFDAQPGVDPAPDPGPRLEPVPRDRHEHPDHRPARGGQDHARDRPRPQGRRRPATAPTSPTPPTSPPAATGPRSRAGGPPPCGSSPDRRCLVIDLCRHRDYAEEAGGGLVGGGFWRLWLGIVTGSRGTPGPCPVGGSGRVAPMRGW